MIVFAQRALWFSYWCFVAVVALLAALYLLLRLTFSSLPAYQVELEEHLGGVLGAEVAIGQLHTYWRGSNPVLEVHNFQLSGDTALTVEKAVIGLDLARSLAFQQPIFKQLEVNRPVINVLIPAEDETAQQPSPRPLNPADATGALWLKLLLRQQHVQVSQASVRLQRVGMPALLLPDINIDLSAGSGLHQLRVLGQLAADVDGSEAARVPFTFTAEVDGSPTFNPLNFYFELPQISQSLFNPWLAHFQLPEIGALEAELKVWGTYKRRALEYISVQGDVKVLKVAGQTFEKVNLRSSLQRGIEGYQAQVEADLVANGKPYILPHISADWKQGLGAIPDQLSADSIDLSRLSAWLDKQPFMPYMAQRAVTMLQPEGHIENLVVRWPQPDWAAFELDADLFNVEVKPWGGAPGLGPVTGRLRHDIRGGSIDLDNNRFTMHFPDLKMPRWEYTFARGHVNWALTDEAVEVGSGLLQLKNKDVTAAGRFFFRLPYDNDKQTDLTLLIGVNDSQGVAFREYIPPAEVGRETHRWLMEAIQGGVVRQGGFMLNANTRSRLPDYQKPVVQLFLDVNDLQFGFDPEWPAVTKGDGFFYYRDFGFMVRAKGKLLDSKVRDAWVYSPPGSQRLRILGKSQGDARDIRRILLETSLREEVGDQLNGWEWSAKARTSVDIDIDLSRKRSPRVSASTALSQGRLVSVQNRLSFENLKGTIRYSTKTGLQAKALNGTLFGQAVDGTILTEENEDKGSVTKVQLHGSAAAEQIKEWLDLSFLSLAQGKTEYDAELQICGSRAFCDQLTISSSLRGVEVKAPAPFGKKAEQARGLDIMLSLSDPLQQKLWVNYDNAARGIFLVVNDQAVSGRIVLGEKAGKLPEQPGLWVEGYVPYIDTAEVQRFLVDAGFIDADKQDANGVSQADNEKTSAGSMPIQDIALDIGRLRMGTLELHQLATRMRKSDTGWQIAGVNEMLKGALFLPDAPIRPAKLQLEYLKVAKDALSSQSAMQTAADTEKGSFDAADLPKLDVAIEALSINDKPLGRWSMALRPDENGVTAQDVVGDMLGIRVRGDARWSTAGVENTAVLAQFESDNLKPFLNAWGYSRYIELSELGVTANLVWEDAPWTFSTEGLNGEFELKAKNGRIIEAGGSGQFLRVLGILNLETLGRRLRLDFTDLFAQGLAFDRLDADYRLLNGQAYTRTPFKLKGPSADMQLTGHLDLANETVDKDMEVVLPVTKNLPIMGVLLGQPQVAGAVYLIDKLIGNRLEKFTTIKYHLSGDWSDPKLELEQGTKNQVRPDNAVFPQGN